MISTIGSVNAAINYLKKFDKDTRIDKYFDYTKMLFISNKNFMKKIDDIQKVRNYMNMENYKNLLILYR